MSSIAIEDEGRGVWGLKYYSTRGLSRVCGKLESHGHDRGRTENDGTSSRVNTATEADISACVVDVSPLLYRFKMVETS